MGAAAPILDALAAGAIPGRTLVIVAHPDDETLFAGAALADASDVWLVHLTDGAPRDPAFARAAGAADREQYAVLRRHELDAALRVLGLESAGRVMLGAPDQEAIEHLPSVIVALARVIGDLRPAVVLAHAYDGGHPDHDAAAFAARAALARAGSDAVLIDLAGYHEADEGRPRVGFLPRPRGGRHTVERVLGDAARRRKDAALACFVSQREVIARLDTGTERFRIGAREDFGAPPHAGRLHYERHGWAVDGGLFRARVADAARALEIATVLP